MPPLLIVDDEDLIRRMLGRLLGRHGYECTLAANAREAREKLEEGRFELVLSDVNMPGESGIDLVRHVLANHPDTAAVMVTGVDDPGVATAVLELGAYGYIIKPFETNELLINVSNALRRRTLEIENRRHRESLEQTVEARTAALQRMVRNLETAKVELMVSREETIQRLARAAEFRSDETAQHIRRMSIYCELLAREAGMSERMCELLRIASPMHDIGKIGTPDRILMKEGRLTPEEFEVMKQHAEIGFRILNGSNSEMLQLAADIAMTHHEKFDGSGYPRGLSGTNIPIHGRITAIADVFDALMSARCYKSAYPLERTLRIMSDGRGSHFDPELLRLFIGRIDDVMKIQHEYADPGTKASA